MQRPACVRCETLEPRLLCAFDTVIPRIPGEFHFFTDASLQTPGLVGTYVDRSLRSDAAQDDWRQTQTVAGTRTDTRFDLSEVDWGRRASVGLTHGADDAWSDFSVQWDGYVQFLTPTLGLKITGYSGSRMWIDADGDGQFAAGGDEFTDNGWGTLHGWQAKGSQRVPRGVYRVRIQYEVGDLVNVFQVAPNPAPMMRVAYLVPSNRTPQDGAVAALQDGMRWMQDWYRDQMDRNGFGPKTVTYETEADGVTPKIYTVRVGVTDAELRRDLWSGTTTAAAAAGVPTFADEQDWLLVPESHLQNPDGTVSGGGSLGLDAGGGYATDGGVAVTGGDSIPWLAPGMLTDDRPYLGARLAGIGPYPLAAAPWYDGTSFSQRSSGVHGALIHELTHGMGLPHEFVNDDNAHGNIMGNGFRGFRGAALPFRYKSDDGYLSHAAALALNVSPFFNPVADATEDQALPRITDLATGSVALVGGELAIHFRATDNAGLAAAILTRNGEMVGQQQLAGNDFDGVFETAFFDAGAMTAYEVHVYDVNGNRTTRATLITPRAGANAAPRPFLRVSPGTVEVNQSVVLDAGPSRDPEGSGLRVEWDLGDGQFVPGSGLVLNKRFAQAGTYLVRVRVTDASGAASISSPVPLRVLPQGPALLAALVNDGASAQRSTVSGLTLRFDRPVVLASSAIRVTRRGGGVAPTFSVTNPSGDATTYLVTFAPGGLNDGVFDLRLQASGVQARTYLAQPMTGGDRTVTFHRLLGDLDGDADVDAADFQTLRRIVQRGRSEGVDVGPFDLNGDARLNVLDLLAVRRRLGRRLDA